MQMKLGEIIDMAADSQTKVNLAVRIADLLTGQPQPQELIKLVDAYKKLPGMKQTDFVGHVVRLTPDFYEYGALCPETHEYPDGTILEEDIISMLTLSMFSNEIETLVVRYGAKTDDGLFNQYGIHMLDGIEVYRSYFDPKDVIEVIEWKI